MNLYGTVLILGLAGRLGGPTPRPGPADLGARATGSLRAGVVVDKVPWPDSAPGTRCTRSSGRRRRPARRGPRHDAGSPEVVAGLLGGGFSLTAHRAKASTHAWSTRRPNRQRRPVVAEDGLVAGMSPSLWRSRWPPVSWPPWSRSGRSPSPGPVPRNPPPPTSVAGPPAPRRGESSRSVRRASRGSSGRAASGRPGGSSPLRRSGWPTSAGGPTRGSDRPVGCARWRSDRGRGSRRGRARAPVGPARAPGRVAGVDGDPPCGVGPGAGGIRARVPAGSRWSSTRSTRWVEGRRAARGVGSSSSSRHGAARCVARDVGVGGRGDLGRARRAGRWAGG